MGHLTAKHLAHLDRQTEAAYRSQFFIGSTDTATPDELRQVLTPASNRYECRATSGDFEDVLTYHTGFSTPEQPLTPQQFQEYLDLVDRRSGVGFWRNPCGFAKQFANTIPSTPRVAAASPELTPLISEAIQTARESLMNHWDKTAEDTTLSPEELDAALLNLEDAASRVEEWTEIRCGDMIIAGNPNNMDVSCEKVEELQSIFKDL